MIGDFPPHVQATVRRILDGEARRLLLADRTSDGTREANFLRADHPPDEIETPNLDS